MPADPALRLHPLALYITVVTLTFALYVDGPPQA